MTIAIQIYRNPHGEVFFRTSRTAGRTRAFRVEAESPTHLEDWLRRNGFRTPEAMRGAGFAPVSDRTTHADRLPAG